MLCLLLKDGLLDERIAVLAAHPAARAGGPAFAHADDPITIARPGPLEIERRRPGRHARMRVIEADDAPTRAGKLLLDLGEQLRVELVAVRARAGLPAVGQRAQLVDAHAAIGRGEIRRDRADQRAAAFLGERL